MSRALPKLIALDGNRGIPDGAVKMGSLVRIDENGRPLVTAVTVGVREPVVARSIVARPDNWDHSAAPLAVLLHFEDGDLTRPIIVGIVKDTFEPVAARPAATSLLDLPLKPGSVTMDGKRLQLEATEEVVLKCGQGSITLQANGRVVIKGTELVSRASGTNKIRGASVAIN